MNDEEFMRLAIKEAKKGDFPYGAVIIKEGKIIAKARNAVIKSKDATQHAEVHVIRKASSKLNKFDLSGCILYATCEPCAMCFGAAWWANISKIIYGSDCGTAEIDHSFNVPIDELNQRTGNKIKITKHILKGECDKLLK